MAANLNRPADFLRQPSKEKNPTFLIPPSEFEKPAAYHKKELDKAKQQVQELQAENEKLKLLQNQLQHQAAATSFSSSQNEYADELIKRQAGEIAELRSELVKCRQAYDQDAGEWDKRFSILEEEHQQEVKKLQKQITSKEDEFEQRLTRISGELQRTLEDSEVETSSLQAKLENTRTTLNKRIKELEEQLTTEQVETDNKIRQLEADLRGKSRTVEDQSHQISKLKTYIGEAEQAYKPAQVWKTEKETVDNKLKLAEAETRKLQSQLELLDVRFKALSDILVVQESELSKAKSDGVGKSKQHGLLLTRWREKVYALLVQQKSSEIVYKNDLNNSAQKMRSLEDQLAASEAQVQVLQHSLTDKSAQLQIEVNNKERLQQELEQTQQVAICLDDQSKVNSDNIKSMADFVERVKQKHDESMKVLEEKSSALKVLAQRVSFAASRMEFLKTQFIRKTAITFSMTNDSRQNLSTSRANEDFSRDSEEHLYQELEKVMRERDSLATQVREDSTKWSDRLTETRSQYKTEITTLKRTIEDLEYDVQQKSKTCAQLTEELQSLQEDTKDKDDTIAQLQAELAKHAKGIESVLTDQRLKDEADWSDKFADMERKLNDSKREHAKAVVSLRQMERNHSRELQRGQELLRTTEEHLSRQLQQLQTQLMNVEKERNIMVATLRQEGLTSKLKSERGEPIHLLDFDDQEDFALPSSSSHSHHHHPPGSYSNTDRGRKASQDSSDLHVDSARGKRLGDSSDEKQMSETTEKDDGISLLPSRQASEPVEHVLEDLRSLTAAIFGEDDDDNDDADDDNNGSVDDEEKNNSHEQNQVQNEDSDENNI